MKPHTLSLSHGSPVSSMAVTKAPLAQYRPHKDANIHVRKGASNHPLHACTVHPRLSDKRDASADSTRAGSEDTSPQHNSEQSRCAGHAGNDGNGRADVCAGPEETPIISLLRDTRVSVGETILQDPRRRRSRGTQPRDLRVAPIRLARHHSPTARSHASRDARLLHSLSHGAGGVVALHLSEEDSLVPPEVKVDLLLRHTIGLHVSPSDRVSEAAERV